ncbi:MAG: hypothetical protein C0626_09715 [Arcobacter sp.]|uniref:hypothetical protein n=1 Tax=uncultured Arcobacter sp. TaxID=165434 RepID=UPI000CC592D9|nr:hypothetical protein [uncultured Arcobacter sp.]PLY09266.1 MAG: hypothetical protein C0626_09715 [Arcobacter sp.]
MSLNTLLLTALILLFILLLLLLYLYKINRKKKVVATTSKQKNINPLDLKLPLLPHTLNSLSNNSIREVAKEVYDVYKILDYKNDEEEYKRDSWHSWQVGFLVAMYKRELELFIPDCKEVFHKEVLTQSPESLRIATKKIIKKYQDKVNIEKTKEVLSKQLIWNAEEVATLMYFLSKYENSSKDKS